MVSVNVCKLDRFFDSRKMTNLEDDELQGFF
jgi:hypothetical protein